MLGTAKAGGSYIGDLTHDLWTVFCRYDLTVDPEGDVMDGGDTDSFDELMEEVDNGDRRKNKSKKRWWSRIKEQKLS